MYSYRRRPQGDYAEEVWTLMSTFERGVLWICLWLSIGNAISNWLHYLKP